MRKIKKEIKMADTLSREEFKQQVISKAELNPEFKQALLDDPQQAIGQLGLKTNTDVKLKVVEESADIVYLVLPQNLKAANGGCIGCDGVGGCGFCECKSNIGDQVQIKNQVQVKNQVQIKNQAQIKNQEQIKNQLQR